MPAKTREINFFISPDDGEVSMIYDERFLLPQSQGEIVTIKRASHVEPTKDGQWTADMSPVSPGVILGPFAKRSEALQAERDWLLDYLKINWRFL